jgi:hypothetical protein
MSATTKISVNGGATVTGKIATDSKGRAVINYRIGEKSHSAFMNNRLNNANQQLEFKPYIDTTSPWLNPK